MIKLIENIRNLELNQIAKIGYLSCFVNLMNITSPCIVCF